MKYFFSLSITGLLLLAAGCSKKLDLDPVGSLSPETVGPADIDKLVNGIYDALQTGNTTFYYLSQVTEDLSADNLRYRATFFQHGEVDNNAILSNNVLTARYFLGPYAVIQRANDVIEIASTATLPEATKKNALAVAYFARAYSYFNLVKLFGGVPVLTKRTIEQVPRNTEAEVYARIIEDLNLALPNSSPLSSNIFISTEAVKGLLARVYLIRKDYANAKKFADETIANTKLALTSDYEAMLNSSVNNAEIIFMVRFTTTEGGNSLSFFLQHPNMPGGGRSELPVDNSLVNAFEPGDIRKPAIMREITAPASNPGWYAYKFRDPTGGAVSPFFVLRVAEMYLISAEAQYFITNQNPTDATMLGRLNAVRTRRGLTAVASADLYKIIAERRVELAFENLRWTDMKRIPSPTDPAKSLAQEFLEAKGRKATDLLYPIPQSEIDVNPLLVQNPGY